MSASALQRLPELSSGTTDDDIVSQPDGAPIAVTIDGQRLITRRMDNGSSTSWTLQAQAENLILRSNGPCSGEPSEAHLLAALEAAFIQHPQHASLTLSSLLPRPDHLLRTGIVNWMPNASPIVFREALWQQARLWLTNTNEPYPLQYTMTQGRRHPRRPPKPSGTVYQRRIPWLAGTLSFRTVDPTQDLALIHRWMNDPVVSHFWQEEGDLAKHRAYLDGIAADPHVVNLIACFDGEPFGYFEVYWAREDRIAPFYEAHDHDRGWHVLIGEPSFRGKPYLTAWLPSISHYLFLDDCRTQRLVIEPRADNQKMIKNLARSGYALLKEFDFPHKRAMLGMLLRERFFGEALWIPRTDSCA